MKKTNPDIGRQDLFGIMEPSQRKENHDGQTNDKDRFTGSGKYEL